MKGASLESSVDSDVEGHKESKSSWFKRLLEIYEEYEILVLFIIVILLAKVYPQLGAEYLAPRITATWIAVVFIFRKYTLLLL